MSRAGGWLTILYMVVYMLLRVGGRFKEGTYIYLWLIHVDVWQKPTHYYKAISLQVKINRLKIIL